MEAGADFQQTGHAAVEHHAAVGGLGDAAENFQQRAFARPVAADDAHDFAVLDIERDIVEGPNGIGRRGRRAAEGDRPILFRGLRRRATVPRVAVQFVRGNARLVSQRLPAPPGARGGIHQRFAQRAVMRLFAGADAIQLRQVFNANGWRHGGELCCGAQSSWDAVLRLAIVISPSLLRVQPFARAAP